MLLVAATAAAMPGDPEIVNIAPGGTGTTTLVRDNLDVTFSCPAYRTGSAGTIADGDAADYRVRLAQGNTEPDGRLPAPGSQSVFGGIGFSEAAAQPIPGTTNCTAELPMTRAFGPPALFFGGVSWQAARRCPGCNNSWEPGPATSVVLRPALEDPVLTIPKRVYAGYLTRFSFATASNLSGATIALQWISRGGWTELGQMPFVPGTEAVFFAKLPAGHRLLRINATAGVLLQLGVPYQEITVLKPGRRRATGPRDDGIYLASPPADPPLNFVVVGDGRRLRRLEASVPITCQSRLPPGPSVTARLRSARIAPDGTIVGRALMPGATPTYVTLDGRVRHGRFEGTVAAAFGDCSGSSDFEAGMIRATSTNGTATLR
jgi:hypothetical protein